MDTQPCSASSQESPQSLCSFFLFWIFINVFAKPGPNYSPLLNPAGSKSPASLQSITEIQLPSQLSPGASGCSQPATGSCHLPPAAPCACQPQPEDTGMELNKGGKRRGKEKGKGNQRLWLQGKASDRAGMQIPIGIHVNMPGVQVAQAKKSQVQDVVPEEALGRGGDGAAPPLH